MNALLDVQIPSQLEANVAALNPSGIGDAQVVSSRPSIARVKYTHDAMVDLIIGRPEISQNELAVSFGYSPSWISNIIASDAFQARLAERTAELVDPMLRLTVEERFKGILLRSIEILNEKLNKPAHQIPDNLALRTGELAAKALGYGARAEAIPVKVDVHNHLNVLGENLTTLLRRKKQEEGVVDVEVKEVIQAISSEAQPAKA